MGAGWERACAVPLGVSRTLGICGPAFKEWAGRAAGSPEGRPDPGLGRQLCLLQLAGGGGRSGRIWVDPPPQQKAKLLEVCSGHHT